MLDPSSVVCCAALDLGDRAPDQPGQAVDRVNCVMHHLPTDGNRADIAPAQQPMAIHHNSIRGERDDKAMNVHTPHINVAPAGPTEDLQRSLVGQMELGKIRSTDESSQREKLGRVSKEFLRRLRAWACLCSRQCDGPILQSDALTVRVLLRCLDPAA